MARRISAARARGTRAAVSAARHAACGGEPPRTQQLRDRRLTVARMALRLSTFALGALLCAGAASAQDDCGKLLPDLTCDRSGRFAGFSMPIVQPYLFEDPFITTGIYPYYVWHQFPKSGALGGGEAHVSAAQIRIAVTDRLAIIATKDGYMWKNPGNPLLKHTQGWMDLGFGLKYAVYQDRDAGRIVSVALKYQAASGAKDSFQDHGDGELMPSITAAAKLGDLALVGDLGGIWAIDHRQSSSFNYHLYAGYPIADIVTPFVQFSGIHWTSGGDGSRLVELSSAGQALVGLQYIPVGPTPGYPVSVVDIYGPVEGADVANLGSPGVGGLDYVTIAIGAHFRVADHLTISAAWERPITDHKSITRNRITTNVALEF
jgi:hypothetical protein